MDRTGTPAKFWLLCLLYVVQLLNHMAVESLGWKTPIQVATGQRPDISAFLYFTFWQPIYYAITDHSHFAPLEKCGRWVGICDHKGDALTYWILTDDTQKCIPRSNIHSALDPATPNLRADQLAPPPTPPPTPPPILHTTHQIAQLPVQPMDLQLPRFQPDDLVGLTFLHDAPDGQRVCACIVEKIEDDNNKTHDTLCLHLAIDDNPDAPEELIAYNELCDLLERQHDDEEKHPEKYWSFQ